MTASRRSRDRTRWLCATAGLSAVLTLAFAGTASATTPITPSSGPTTGGTTVSVAAGTLGFTQIADADGTGYGLSGDGHIYAWGSNGSGDLGDGGTAASDLPVRVLQGAIPTGVTITQIAAGWEGGYALGSDGRVYSWGGNFSGQLGDGTTTATSAPVAVDLSGLAAGVGITQVAAGEDDAYAVGSDGNIYSWGYNHDGELGNGNNTDSDTPVIVDTAGMPIGVKFTQVAVGQITAFGIGTDGHVYSWGSDVSGALGTGVPGDENVPTAIAAGAIPGGVKITEIAGGQEGGYALGDDGNVYSWGSDQFGDLGDDGNTDSDVPVEIAAGQIPTGLKMTAIAGGSSSGYALGSDGSMYAWGNGGNGQLGNGSSTGSSTPVLVSAGEIPTGVLLTSVSGAYHSAIALGSDGRVYGWGDNNLGDLADGTSTQRTSPVLGANVSLTNITFGGVAGTDLVDPPGVATAVAPAHAAGVVAVAVTGTINGGATASTMTSRTLPAAFTYTSAVAGSSNGRSSAGVAATPALPETGVAVPWWLLCIGCGTITIGTVMVSRRVGFKNGHS